MGRRSEKELRRVLVPLFADDYEKLQLLYKRRAHNDVNPGVAAIIRSLVHTFLRQTQAEIDRQIDRSNDA